MVIRSFSCLFANYRGKFDTINVMAMAIFATLPVLMENVSRVESYSVFTIPKVLEGLWDLLQKLGYVKNIPYSLPVLFAISMASLLVLKKNITQKICQAAI